MLPGSEVRHPPDVEFDLKLDDLIAYYRHPKSGMTEGFRRAVRRTPWIIATFLAFGAAFVGALMLSERPFNPAEWGLLVLVSAGVGALGTCTMFTSKGRAKVAAIRAKRETPLGHWSLHLTDEGLAGQTARAGVQCWWTNAEHVLVTDSHIFVGPSPVVVIPRRAFANEREFRQFAATCRRHLQREREKSIEALAEARARPAGIDHSTTFKFSYEVTPELLKEAVKQMSYRQYTTGSVLGCLFFLVGLAVIGAVIVILTGPKWYGILMIAGPLIVFGLSYLQILATHRQATEAGRATRSPLVEMYVDTDGIRWKGSDGETELKWNAMKSLWKSRDVWLIFVQSRSIYRVVPADAITDDAKAFIEERIRWVGGTIA